MPTIEKLAENFVKAANELLEASGGFCIDFFLDGPAIQMNEAAFNSFTKGMEVVTIDRKDMKYPVERWLNIGGVKFYCLYKDWDTWAKLKGYVKEAV